MERLDMSKLQERMVDIKTNTESILMTDPIKWSKEVLSGENEVRVSKRGIEEIKKFPIANDDTYSSPDNGKDGYIKTDQFYYFNKSKLSYKRIGYVDYDIMRLIFEFIEESSFEIERKTDNL